MGFCPNCGSWVEEGDVCNFCGGSRSVNENHESYGGYSSGGYRKPQKEYVPARKIKSSLKSNPWFDDEIWGNVDLEVLEALNRYDNSVQEELNSLNELINRELRFHRFYRMRLDCYKSICVEFIRQDEYVDVVEGQVYVGKVFDALDEYEYYLDTRIRDIPEFGEMVRQVESEGFEYECISTYASYFPERAYFKFIKEDYRHRNYIFDFKQKTWELSSEYSHPCILMRSERETSEKRFLLNEIERLKKIHYRQFYECRSDIFKFTNPSKNMVFYYRYDDTKHKLNLEAKCTFKNQEDYDGQYGFLSPY